MNPSVEDRLVTSADVLEKARASLRSEPRLDLHATPVALEFAEGVLTAEGEVSSVAAKKLALERLAALPEVTGIVDRLHVQPAERMGDGRIGDLVRDALLQEPAFAELTILEERAGHVETVRVPPTGSHGEIRYLVEDGVVTLSGEIPGLGRKRLAGVLAWWVPGSRDVVNGLAVVPPEEDSNGEMTDAVRIVLEKDPFVNASQIRVASRDRLVTLEGLVATEAERDMAEYDAWCVFGVDRVLNEIAVRP
jgi:osmotically-inducible protein OsmY